MYDVLIIGGGVVGGMILRELSKYKLSCVLLEKADDVSVGATRANSGIVHAGYDCKPNTLKARFNVLGNKMLYSIANELNVPCQKIGSLVVSDENGLGSLKDLLDRGTQNGVDCKIIDREQILAIEPNVSDTVMYALYAKEAGVISPYKLAIATIDHAIINGAEVRLNEEVINVIKKDGCFEVITKNNKYESKVVINSAGGYAVDINRMVGEITPEVEYRRGEYYVLDKSERKNISTVLFPLPDENGKGILVSPTADDNVIYGPTSTLTDRENNITTSEGLAQIDAQVKKSYKCPNLRKLIRLYSGMRCAVGEDFIIEESKKVDGFIILLGICSPALTSSPAIAEYVVTELVSRYFALEKKEGYKAYTKPIKITKLNENELNTLIKKDSRFGRVVCRCETVSEGEIVNAIHSPLPATTVDAVKRRVRAGMGRCQGGFCMPMVVKILAKELNIPVTKVKKGGENSEIAISKVSEVKYEF